nr:substrate-binding domain-containing protein [Desulfosporosinus sp. BICA1-9]
MGAVDSVHNYILPPVYRALIQHSQHLEIRLKTYLGFELYSLLEKGEIDIAFALFEKPMPNMIIQKFYSEPMVVIREGNHSEQGDFISLLSLDPDNELYHEWSPTFRTWYDQHRKDVKFSGIRVDSAGLILTLLNNPGKWSIIPMSMARKFITLGTFTLSNLDGSPPERMYYQARPRYPSARVAESLQILDSCLSIIHDNTYPVFRTHNLLNGKVR